MRTGGAAGASGKSGASRLRSQICESSSSGKLTKLAGSNTRAHEGRGPAVAVQADSQLSTQKILFRIGRHEPLPRRRTGRDRALTGRRVGPSRGKQNTHLLKSVHKYTNLPGSAAREARLSATNSTPLAQMERTLPEKLNPTAHLRATLTRTKPNPRVSSSG